MTFLSLFAGIGGIDLGLERSGMRCIGQVEIDPFCRAVLAKHWPDVPRFDDVRTFNAGMLNERPDLICGGFPCQDISAANPGGEGIDGDRSGLWSEFSRLLGEVPDCIALVENVSALLWRGLNTVLGDLAEGGRDAEWESLPAFPFGAPHYRERVLIVAYPERRRLEGGILGRTKPSAIVPPSNRRTSFGTYLGETWGDEPQISLLDDGLSGGLAEFSSRATGNAVVPQVAEWIGRRIIAARLKGFP